MFEGKRTHDAPTDDVTASGLDGAFYAAASSENIGRVGADDLMGQYNSHVHRVESFHHIRMATRITKTSDGTDWLHSLFGDGIAPANCGPECAI